ncbi:MAG: DNA-processing protein DprA [bacterium]
MERLFRAAVTDAPPWTLLLASPRYPVRLRHIADPPVLLYVRGQVRPEEPAVAIVGSRRATATGRLVTERLAAGLAERGVTVVSGLARGIDAVAHRAALDAGGRTIAVLGCGVDLVYPPEHAELAAAIARSGCVLTELPPGTPPLPHHFPRRNRLIAGLALGVVVVEGDERSGALSTAASALNEGREVMATPGSVLNPLTRAPHALLRQGATLVESAEEVLAAVGLPVEPGDPIGPAGPMEQPEGVAALVWQAVGTEPTHIDEVVDGSGLPAAEVAALLIELELRSLVRPLPGKHFIRVWRASVRQRHDP